MKKLFDLFQKYREIIMYMFIGGLTSLVNWITYAICTETLTLGDLLSAPLNMEASTINIFLAGVIAWILAVAFAYITNKLLVFQSFNWKPSFVLKECTLFVSSRILTGLLEIVGVPFLVNLGFDQTIFGIDGMVCKLVVSVLVVVLNYVFSKLFIFKNKE